MSHPSAASESRPTSESTELLEVRDLRVDFVSRRGVGHALNGVSFSLSKGETLGLVGESGSGKSVTALSIANLLPEPAARLISGEVWHGGVDLLSQSEQTMRSEYRGKIIAMVLQDPMTALNPVLTIGRQIAAPLREHTSLRKGELRDRVVELLTLMGIPQPQERLDSYPHQFSGGMRQRVVGAIALSCDPEILIADEPTTALDVTVQAGYLDLLRDIQDRTGVGIIFITHDLGVVGSLCDRVAVMYAGRIVETAPTRRIFESAKHPYTKALLRSVPDVDGSRERLPSIGGSPPSIFEPPSGCPFHPRCELYEELGKPDRCRSEDPALGSVQEDHGAACHFKDESDEVLGVDGPASTLNSGRPSPVSDRPAVGED